MGNFYYFGHVKGKQPALDNEFYSKVLPTMFVAALLWLLSTLYFSGLFGAPALDLTTFSIPQIIIALCVFVGVWILLMIFTFLRVNLIAMVLFFISALGSGVLLSFVVSFVAEDLGEELTRSLFITSALIGVFATGGAMALGILLKDKISKHYCWYFLLFGILFGVLEVVIIAIFGEGENNIVVDLLMFGYLFGVMVFDAATLPGKIKRGYWMMAVIDIFFDFVGMVLRIFMILSKLASKKKK
ncbi:hypothetical protein NEF87_001135 [Candidatus Lokiarchaeum ossiferum]|uniref:Bax inhibitor-1/YccA family protein n=1 Tax=Candidatus Lokiarchaeum ossiferum TaxID=2951803 RepID=A0ABY6HMW1_9ARCH|nr:hypothetical protein NEF87_001135 [Candidatus Lokiarchaeum sp. B-35]